jgi:hypothetical protein
VLTDAGILRYNTDLELLSTAGLYNLQRIQYVDGALYYFTQEEIRLLA